MLDTSEPQYLYLTTTGRKTGKPHQIEIWFVTHDACCYLISETPERSDWVRNVRHNPTVIFSIGTRDDDAIAGTGRLIDRETEPELAAAVSTLMDAKYNWSSGQIVELKPNSSGSE